MKIVFMGTPEFAVPALNILLENNYDIPAVVTVPDKPKGRGLQMQFPAVKQFANENNLNILQPDSLKDESFINKLKSLNPDLIIVVAFRILPREVYSIPIIGSFNLHASLLPKYRGAAPINWALIKGEEQTGVTTFFLQDKVDTGNIILQKSIPIKSSDNAGTLHDKLSVLGSQTVLETVKLIETGKYSLQNQDDSLATRAPKIFKNDCRINWNQKSDHIHNFIRGLSPYPAAFSLLQGKQIKIYSSELTSMPVSALPGSAVISQNKLYVNTLDCLLEISELQLEGKKRITASDFINGLQVQTNLFFD